MERQGLGVTVEAGGGGVSASGPNVEPAAGLILPLAFRTGDKWAVLLGEDQQPSAGRDQLPYP